MSEHVRLAIVSTYFWPEQTGISQVTWELASFFASHAVDVEVVTAMPFYPEWEIAQTHRRKIWSTENAGGITIRRSWHFVGRNPSTIVRLLHEGTLAITALPNLIRAFRASQHAYIVSPDLTFAFVGSVVAKLAGVPITLIVQDVMPDAAIELGLLRSRAAIWLSRCIARALYQTADRIFTLSDGMRDRIAQLHRDSSRIEIVPNTIDAAELRPPAPHENEFRRRFATGDVFAVVHTGNMGRKQDLDLLLDAASVLRDDPTIQFYIFGDGAERERILARRDGLGLTNLHHHPLQERRLLPHVLAGADLLLVSQRAEVVDIVVPSKFLTAAGAGAAIVAACHPESELAKLVRESDGGTLIPASDCTALVDTIHAMRRSPDIFAPRRENARAFATKHFDRKKVFGRLVEELRPRDADAIAR